MNAVQLLLAQLKARGYSNFLLNTDYPIPKNLQTKWHENNRFKRV